MTATPEPLAQVAARVRSALPVLATILGKAELTEGAAQALALLADLDAALATTLCPHGRHRLVVIHSSPGVVGEKVTRWCEVCGAVVVDGQADGRLRPGHYVKLRRPLATSLPAPATPTEAPR